jgi:hypothetical protein
MAAEVPLVVGILFRGFALETDFNVGASQDGDAELEELDGNMRSPLGIHFWRDYRNKGEDTMMEELILEVQNVDP